MLKKILLTAGIMLLSAASFAHAECTAEQIQAKNQEFTTQLVALMQKDPAKGAQLSQEMQKELPALDGTTDTEALCKFYDSMLAKLKN